MKEGNLKHFVILFCILIIFFCFNIIIYDKGVLEVSFFDVGQGDACLIKTPDEQNILIDGGPDDKVLDELSTKLSWSDQIIDLMILTHPHDDHVAGLNEVLKKYEVRKILYTGVIHNSPAYVSWLEKVRELKIPILIIDHPRSIKLGENCRLNILYPFETLLDKEVDNLNNSSIVVQLDCEGSKILFMGDIEEKIEKELLEEEIDLESNILKIGHHGSDTSSSEDFLKAVMPKKAIISVGADNMFGHPSRRVENRLERLGIEIYRTDEDGRIVESFN